MHHFFVPKEQISETQIRILGTDVNHINNVLRMQQGEEIRISDGYGMTYHCRITAQERDVVTAEILTGAPVASELPVSVTLFQGFPKADKLETIIQKAIELGACEIVPVMMERCVVKWEPKKAQRKLERWNGIAEAAAKQSGRGILPTVKEPVAFDEACRLLEEFDRILLPYELAEHMEATRQCLSALEPGMKIAVMIGPEGGIAGTEVEAVRSLGGTAITLGRRILRTETAGPAVLAMLSYVLER